MRIEKKLLTIILLLFASACFAQKNEVVAYAMGNWNPTYFATQNGNVFAGETSPGVGYGLSYSRALNKRNALTLLAGEDNIDALLYEGNNQFFTWSIRRYEVSVSAVQQWTHKKTGVTGFIFEGPGAIVTHSSPKLSGWSANFAIMTGFGVAVPMNNHFSWQARMSFEDSNTGCYGDKGCHFAEWAVTQNAWSGLAVSW